MFFLIGNLESIPTSILASCLTSTDLYYTSLLPMLYMVYMHITETGIQSSVELRCCILILDSCLYVLSLPSIDVNPPLLSLNLFGVTGVTAESTIEVPVVCNIYPTRF